jgi:RNA polymerase sigma factor (TIGR02999 family)
MTVEGGRSPAAPPEVTQLLLAWSDGDQTALERLMPLVEAELRRLASAYMARERPGHVLQTTALVNEAYLRLIDWKNVQWQNRAHFFGAAAGMMRRILVDVARRQRREKRGAGAVAVSLSNAADVIAPERTDLVALDDALQALTELDPRQAKVVELRFFGGLTHEEAALVLDVSPATVRRDWTLARAWLYRELNAGNAP